MRAFAGQHQLLLTPNLSVTARASSVFTTGPAGADGNKTGWALAAPTLLCNDHTKIAGYNVMGWVDELRIRTGM
jgi:hypothetical protein